MRFQHRRIYFRVNNAITFLAEVWFYYDFIVNMHLKKLNLFETGDPFQAVYSTERRMIHREREADKQPALVYLSHTLYKRSLAWQSQQRRELQDKEIVAHILSANFSLQFSTDDRSSLFLNR